MWKVTVIQQSRMSVNGKRINKPVAWVVLRCGTELDVLVNVTNSLKADDKDPVLGVETLAINIEKVV